MSIAEKIRQQRKLMNFSQEELAHRVGVSLKTVQRWEAGERSPRVGEITKLSEVLGTTVDSFVGAESGTVQASESPNMAYWGGVLDNARLAVKSGENLNLIYSLLADATGTVKAAMA